MKNDPAVAAAKAILERHFVDEKNRPIRTPYYQHQLQVLYEDKFFEWIITAALDRLVKEEYLVVFDRQNTPELGRMDKISGMKFYANADAVRTDRGYGQMKKHVVSTANLVKRYSSDDVARMLGAQLESLVQNQLQISQFEIVGVHTNEYSGKRWGRTHHNLDIIAKKKGKDFTICVEVKNTLGIMDPKEIDTKIDICKHLGIVPVFAVRWNKPYFECVRKQGGFNWFFKTQMFPIGQEKFTRQLYTKLSVRSRLKFPITVRNSLPEKTVKVFENWVRQKEDNPPEINTACRCKKTQGA